MRPQMRRQKAEGRRQKRFFLFLLSLSLHPLLFLLYPSLIFPLHPATAQTIQDRKVEADRLLQQGIQQIQTNQLPAAVQSLEQALTIYRQLQHRPGEGAALIGLGETNLRLGNVVKALELSQQALAIAKELNNPEMEKFARQVLQAAQIADNPQKREADRLLQQGTQQIQTNQLPAAVQSLEQALTLYRRLQHRAGEGAALIGLCETNLRLGNPAKALELSQQALAIAKELNSAEMEKLARQVLQAAQIATNPQKREADRLLQQGTQQIQTNQLQVAIQSLKQARTLYRQLKHRPGEGAALIGLGETNLRLGNIAKALELSQQAIAIAKELNNSEIEKLAQQVLDAAQQITNSNVPASFQKVEADRLLQQGIQQYQTSQFEAAFQSWQQALQIYRGIKARLGEGRVLSNLGLAYRAIGNYGKATEFHEQALAITREIKDRQGEGNALGNLGSAYFLLGNYSRATEFYEQHLTIAKQIKDRGGESNALDGLGLAYRALGNYGKAIEFHEQALAIAREIKDRQGEGNALGNLGLAYGALGNYGKAIEFHEQALAIAKQIKDRGGESSALDGLGLAYRDLGNYGKAIEFHEQALAITREIKNRQGEGNALGNLGSAYFLLGNYSRAIEFHEQALAITREIKNRQGEGSILGNLGVAYRTLGNYGKAIEFHEQALAIAREVKAREREGTNLGNLGLAYFSLGNYGKAIEFHEQALAVARQIKNQQGEGIALNNLGNALFKSGNLVVAIKTLMDGVATWELLRQTGAENDANKVSIFEQQTVTYRTLQKVLVAQNQPNAALEIAERGRARAFVELLAQRLSGQEATSLIPQAQQASMTLKGTKPPTLQEIQQIARAQNATLVQYSVIFDDFQIQGKEEARQSELYIWVIPPQDDITFRKVDLKPLWQQQNTNLAQLVVQSREGMGVRGRADVEVALSPEFLKRQQEKQTRNLKQLHQLLIAPIAPLLPQDPNQRVIFMPQGELFLVPFPALLDANGTALIEQHTILTAPSIQVLELTRQQRDRLTSRQSVAGKSLIVGNPTMPKVVTQLGDTPVQLSDLPGAKQEALAIAQLLNTQAITGQQATKTAIAQQMPNARLIHFATHGLLDDVKGLGVPGAIALAPAGNGQLNDGLLTAAEILEMKLNAELVVLSACDTGRGRITGDGVIGLSRSLITAGVPSIIVSLWKVPDDSTAFLMTEFYQNLQKTPDKAQALRQAMLTTKQKYPEPLNWAAFTLIGEAE
ncbi:tetratricopeptide repeat protein [Pantanalinema sp. GBBB05]|uniref:CHAT domain-containing tetratricopeptide repeat protein n=1 Tax=Pantanalinema sp. GBBB05 TaxID=2604139 RepID=UPI001DB40387|nr:tetratricopeptide repeat protein [Pantanalinema sp. GBBB05]